MKPTCGTVHPHEELARVLCRLSALQHLRCCVCNERRLHGLWRSVGTDFPWKTKLHSISDLNTICSLILTLNGGVVFSQTPSYVYSDDKHALVWSLLQVTAPILVTVLALTVVLVAGYRESGASSQTAHSQLVMNELLATSKSVIQQHLRRI